MLKNEYQYQREANLNNGR